MMWSPLICSQADLNQDRYVSIGELFNYVRTKVQRYTQNAQNPTIMGEYDEDKLVNLGLNRWFTRIALPVKYHFGAFSPGYMGSFEITPSVWMFEDNDDLLGETLENDPIWQLEAHLTQDFTPTVFGSIDLLFRKGFESTIGGVEAGEELDIGDLGYTLNVTTTDNLMIRASFSSNVFGDNAIESSLIRMQLVYGWHEATENNKKLQHH